MECLTTLQECFFSAEPMRTGSKEESPETKLLWALQPAFAYGRVLLNNRLSALGLPSRGIGFSGGALLDAFHAALTDRLSFIALRALVLEMHIASRSGELQARDSQARFLEYVHHLRDPVTTWSRLAHYPCLLRLVQQVVQDQAEFFSAFAAHLAEDLPAILHVLGPDLRATPIRHVEISDGDVHCGGRRPLVCTCEDGMRIIYKPRSLAIDAWLAELVERLCADDALLELKVPRVVIGSDHGWAEFIVPADVEDAAALRRFFTRQGQWLAILRALNGNDIHFENLIGSGEFPVPVDLETFAQPVLANDHVASADDACRDFFLRSVLPVGLLPVPVSAGNPTETIDVSALGAVKDQPLLDTVTFWHARGTDAMSVRRTRGNLKAGMHLPREDTNLPDHLQDLLDGHAAAYRRLQALAPELRETLLPLLSECRLRVVLRATRIYWSYLSESMHPALLADEESRRTFFSELERLPISCPTAAVVAGAEIAELWRGDIPYFSVTGASRHLEGAGSAKFDAVICTDARHEADARLSAMSEVDLERQSWLIAASVVAATPKVAPVIRLSAGEPARVRPPLESLERRAIFQAVSIGDRLLATAVHEGDQATWPTMAPVGEQRWMIGPSGLDLYSGLPGIALFLACLARETGASRFRSAAHKALNATLDQEGRFEKHLISVGAFNGWGGLLYAYSHLGSLLERHELLVHSGAILDRVRQGVARDARFDIIGGAAGCLSTLRVLEGYARIHGAAHIAGRAAEIASACVQRLSDAAAPQAVGVAWMTDQPDAAAAGFAHGAAGIAWALSKHGDGSTDDLIQDAIRCERQELRIPKVIPADGPEMIAWCNGVVGLGLARATMAQGHRDSLMQIEIESALKAVLDAGFGRGHCLCHGDLGNLSLIEHQLGARDPKKVAAIHKEIVSSIERHGRRCGTPGQIELPGLMNGLSGIGLGLLRIARPGRAPDVTLLESFQ